MDGAPKRYLKKVGIARLQFTQDHYAVYAARTVDHRRAYIILPAANEDNAKRLCEAVRSAGLYFPDLPSLYHEAKLAGVARRNARGIVAVASGWVDDSHDAFVFGDRVLTRKGGGERFVVACPNFDQGRPYNIAGVGTLAPDTRAARRTSGSRKDWSANVGRPLRYSSVGMFVASAAFAAPLLRMFSMDPFMVLLADVSSGGKTTLELAAASIVGVASVADLPTWKTTDAAVEQRAHEFCDMIFPVDELGHVGGAAKVLQKLQDAAHWAAAGALTQKHDRAVTAVAGRPVRQTGARLILLTSFERSLAELEADVHTEIEDGARVRIIELPSAANLPAEGVIDRLIEHRPQEERTKFGEEWAEAIRAGCSSFHGEVFVAWINEILARPNLARKKIKGHYKRFREGLQFDRSSRLQARHSKPIAFVYACGAHASECGLLPWSLTTFRDAITACHRASRKRLLDRTNANEAMLGDLLRRLNSPRIVTADKIGQLRSVTVDADGWVSPAEPGRTYRIFAEQFRAWFPNGRTRARFERELLKKGLLHADAKGNHTKQVRLPGKGGERAQVYEIHQPATGS